MMKRILIVLIGVWCVVQTAFAQNDNVSMLLQSPHGHTVKLIWFLKTWESDIKSFDIKRREGLQKEWVKLNKEPIVPEISLKKNLSIIESDKNEAEGIKSELIKLLQAHKIEEIDSVSFLKRFNSDDRFLQDFFRQISENYDIALISGFGYIDRTVSKKIDYEYGLFVHGTDKLLARANWNYGEYPDLNVIKEITSRCANKKRGIEIFWNVDVNKLKSGYIHGFNIYRDGIRLNQDPVMIGFNNDLSEFEWYDSTANTDIANLYSISSESLLDIEGIIKPYTYNPDDHAKEYKKAEVAKVTSLGYYFKEGIHISWNFPKEYEHFIKGYYIEKDNMPDGYKRVSPLLEPSVREYVDKTASPVSSYVKFRVVVVYSDRSIIQGKDKVYNYFPLREPPPPQNVKVKTTFAKDNLNIDLTWDPPMSGDTITDYYQLYVYDKLSERLILNTKIPPIKSNKYTYVVGSQGSDNVYKFCISSISKTRTESQLSDTVIAHAPTVVVPRPVITNSLVSGNNVTISWQYTDFPDLKGFRLYVNKKMLISEEDITKSMRSFKVEMLSDTDSGYEISLQAVTDNKIVSEFSAPSFVTISVKGAKKR